MFEILKTESAGKHIIGIKNKPPLNQKKRWFQGYRCESDIVIFEGANRRSVPLNHLNVDQEKKNIYFEEYVWKE